MLFVPGPSTIRLPAMPVYSVARYDGRASETTIGVPAARGVLALYLREAKPV